MSRLCITSRLRRCRQWLILLLNTDKAAQRLRKLNLFSNGYWCDRIFLLCKFCFFKGLLINLLGLQEATCVSSERLSCVGCNRPNALLCSVPSCNILVH